jgi:hypothetical protein
MLYLAGGVAQAIELLPCKKNKYLNKLCIPKILRNEGETNQNIL